MWRSFHAFIFAAPASRALGYPVARNIERLRRVTSFRLIRFRNIRSQPADIVGVSRRAISSATHFPIPELQSIIKTTAISPRLPF